ncbi:MAG: hypothetical protein IPK97_10330 [Ahniella sp.]|nr:hypothetical protein [Ahniella sp.]
MHIKDAQQDFRFSFFAGATGLFASASVWLAAGLVGLAKSPGIGMLTLFFGGMLIYPLSLVLCRLLGRSGKQLPDNTLANLGMESTVQMLLGIIMAFALASFRIEWFFPAMLVVIGGRYLLFATLYGLKLYWLCGGILIAAAAVLVMINAPVLWGAFVGSAIEFAFAAILYPVGRRSTAVGT